MVTGRQFECYWPRGCRYGGWPNYWAYQSLNPWHGWACPYDDRECPGRFVQVCRWHVYVPQQTISFWLRNFGNGVGRDIGKQPVNTNNSRYEHTNINHPVRLLRLLIDQMKDERNALILELYLRCWTEQQIAKEVGLKQQQVNSVITDFPKNQKNGNPPSSLQLFNIWEFGQADNSYGDKEFPGRFAGARKHLVRQRN